MTGETIGRDDTHKHKHRIYPTEPTAPPGPEDLGPPITDASVTGRLLRELVDTLKTTSERIATTGTWLFPLSEQYSPIQVNITRQLAAGAVYDVIDKAETGYLHGPATLISDSPNIDLWIQLQSDAYFYENRSTIAALQANGRTVPMNNGVWVDMWNPPGLYVVTGTWLFLPYRTHIMVRLTNNGAAQANVTYRHLRYRILKEPRIP